MIFPIAQDMRCAVVVAHPDDETLWCAGMLLRYPADWTVICCSVPRKDPIRAWKFQEACLRLGAKSMLYPYVEDLSAPFDHLDNIDLSKYDLVVTHNEQGEYGHAHHKKVNQYVRSVKPNRMCVFGYGMTLRAASAYSEVVEVHLTDDEYQGKLNVLSSYDHVIMWGGQKRPCWEALLRDFSPRFNLQQENYFVV